MMEDQRMKDINNVLDLIDYNLCWRDEYSKRLWNILSALRGPDNENEDLKSSTTAVLRSAAFQNTAKFIRICHPYVNGVKFADENMVLYYSECDNFSSHFGKHVRDAAEALTFLGRPRRPRRTLEGKENGHTENRLATEGT